jgi:hypothetical protein
MKRVKEEEHSLYHRKRKKKGTTISKRQSDIAFWSADANRWIEDSTS